MCDDVLISYRCRMSTKHGRHHRGYSQRINLELLPRMREVLVASSELGALSAGVKRAIG